MLEKINSGAAFDAVKSTPMPKVNSTESAHNGATFQSYYSASDEHQGAVSAKAKPETGLTEVDPVIATEDKQTELSAGDDDPSKLHASETAEGRSEIDGVETVVPDTVEPEPVLTLPIHSDFVTSTQGDGGKTGMQDDSAEGLSSESVAPVLGAATSSPDSTRTEQVNKSDAPRSDQSAPREKVRRTAHRSIAEMRMTSTQPGTATSQPPNTSGSVEQGLEKGQTASPWTDSHNSNRVAETAQNAPAAADKAAQTAVATQSVPKSTQGNKTRNTAATQPDFQAKQQADQAKAPDLPEALQRVMEPVREESAAPVSVSASAQPPRRTATAAPIVIPQAQTTASEPIIVSDAEVLLLEPLSVEPAGLSQLLTEAVMSPGTTHRPETPRLIAVQLAEALATKGERNIDVALNPEELGRVKMRVTTTDTSVIVTITTERPETGDLMRRHINELSEEFRRMGFEDISFEFSGEGMSGQMGNGGEQGDSLNGGSSGPDSGGSQAENVPEPAKQNLRLGETGLDMRI
ncbi:hypothetical protein A9Q94_18470 [Rhodobacterales bacterium 56_14_T64]|nr:hypothetical protein A9Q94_18470 [Rhodobacterales bacterium 56_14_T64]